MGNYTLYSRRMADDNRMRTHTTANLKLTIENVMVCPAADISQIFPRNSRLIVIKCNILSFVNIIRKTHTHTGSSVFLLNVCVMFCFHLPDLL